MYGPYDRYSRDWSRAREERGLESEHEYLTNLHVYGPMPNIDYEVKQPGIWEERDDNA